MMICQTCKQVHPLKGTDKWCDRSELEIKYDYLKDENERYREALFKIMVMTNDPKSILYHVSCEALGLDEPDEVYDYDGL